MSKGGDFAIYVSDPYPAWCNLTYNGYVIRFSHTELSDLKYAVEKAMQEARRKLGKDADEV